MKFNVKSRGKKIKSKLKLKLATAKITIFILKHIPFHFQKRTKTKPGVPLQKNTVWKSREEKKPGKKEDKIICSMMLKSFLHYLTT